VQVRSHSVPRGIDGALTAGKDRRDCAALSGVEPDVVGEALYNVVRIRSRRVMRGRAAALKTDAGNRPAKKRHGE